MLNIDQAWIQRQITTGGYNTQLLPLSHQLQDTQSKGMGMEDLGAIARLAAAHAATMITASLAGALVEEEGQVNQLAQRSRTVRTFSVCALLAHSAQVHLFLGQAQPVPWGPQALVVEKEC
jgi:hypothetical protein